MLCIFVGPERFLVAVLYFMVVSLTVGLICILSDLSVQFHIFVSVNVCISTQRLAERAVMCSAVFLIAVLLCSGFGLVYSVACSKTP